MSSLQHLQKLQTISDMLLSNEKLSPHLGRYESPTFELHYEGEVVAKERARSARGHHYTPEKTRKFQETIKQLAQAKMKEIGQYRFYRHCVIHLEIIDNIPKDWPWWMVKLAEAGCLIYNTTGGDLDNKEKAILDAFNKVVFDDDRLVVQVYKFRKYGHHTGFHIYVSQVGLTKGDLAIIKKHVENHDGKKASKP